MSVIVIGDRRVGKTSMIVSLARGTKNVKVIQPDPESLIERLSNPETGEIAGTFDKKEETLWLSVKLTKERAIKVHWIDTPGEAWSSNTWRQENPSKWQKIIKSASQSQAIVLLMPPFRATLEPSRFDEKTHLDMFPSREEWLEQIDEKLSFFRKSCPKVQFIVISLHKADLMNSFAQERQWQYHPEKDFNWTDYNHYIYRTHFDLAEDIIRQHNTQSPYLVPRFFLTTIKKPTFLELPWVYLGTYLAYD